MARKEKKQVLITGGSGFAGSHLFELLQLDEDVEIHITHIAPVSAAVRNLAADNVHFHYVDLTDQTQTETLIQEIMPTQVYQLASVAKVGDSQNQVQEVLRINQAIIVNILEAIRKFSPLAQTLVISSAEVYGKSLPSELPIHEGHALRPANPYGVSKVTQDLLAGIYFQSFGLQILIARPFNHIGERQEPGFVLSDFCRQVVAIERGQQPALKVGNLDAQRDFTDVKDMVLAYQRLMAEGEIGQVYNIGSGQSLSMRELIDHLIKLAKTKITVEIDSSRLRPADIPCMLADTSKINRLGWRPDISLDSTLERVLAYWRAQS